MLVHRFFAALAVSATSALCGVAHAADTPTPLVIQAPVVDDSDCARGSVLGRIKHRFAYAEHTNWHRGFTIATLENARSSHHPYSEPGLVKRDYCTADSIMTDGTVRAVYYTVEHRLGFAGIGTYVDFCVLGLDPWHVYDEACRVVR